MPDLNGSFDPARDRQSQEVAGSGTEQALRRKSEALNLAREWRRASPNAETFPPAKRPRVLDLIVVHEREEQVVEDVGRA